jgi:hypothetical protein
MAEVYYRGTPDAQRQRRTRRYNPDGGYIESSDFASFSEAQIIQLFNWAAGQGLEAEMTSKFGRHELTINDTRGETRIDRWEFGVSEEQPSVLQNPYLKQSYAGEALDGWELAVVFQAIHKGIKLVDAVEDEDVVAEHGSLPYALLSDRAKRVFKAMKLGRTQYQTGLLVLRHTTNVSNRFNLNISDINENTIYYHSDFLAEVLDPALWLFPLPGRLEYKATSFFNRNEPAAEDHYLYGWLKSVSPETSVANQRVEISTTYKLDFWPLDNYRTT